MSATYTCEYCKGTFETSRTDEEAEQEHREAFPEVGKNAPKAILCDECYQKFVEWINAHPSIRSTRWHQ